MTREQLEKETIEQCSKGYASRIPAPKDETEFKQNSPKHISRELN